MQTDQDNLSSELRAIAAAPVVKTSATIIWQAERTARRANITQQEVLARYLLLGAALEPALSKFYGPIIEKARRDRIDLAALDVFRTRQAAEHWINQPCHALEGRTPASFLDTETEAAKVLRLLSEMQSGDPA